MQKPKQWNQVAVYNDRLRSRSLPQKRCPVCGKWMKKFPYAERIKKACTKDCRYLLLAKKRGALIAGGTAKCSFFGCGRKHFAKGFCRNHYLTRIWAKSASGMSSIRKTKKSDAVKNRNRTKSAAAVKTLKNWYVKQLLKYEGIQKNQMVYAVVDAKRFLMTINRFFDADFHLLSHD